MYILSSKVCGEVEFALILRAHDPLLLVVAHQLLKEVGLPPQRDVLHEVEGVLHATHHLTVQLSQKAKRTLNFEAGNEI